MDEVFLICVLLGMVLSVPFAWLVGLFNPLGYIGVLPWRVPKQARAWCGQHGMRNCFCRGRSPEA